MASLGPGFTYTVFAVAIFVVAVPFSLLSVLLEPWSSTYSRALGSCLGGLLGFGVAATIVLQIDPATTYTSLLMVFGYAIVPVLFATVALFGLWRLRFEHALKYATGSWIVAHVAIFAPGIGLNPVLAGDTAPIFTFIDHTPGVFGLNWYTGFLALTTCVGAISAFLGHRLFHRGPRP